MTRQDAVHIGTSGWHYKHWKGPFYPDGLPDDELLPYYADRFHTVEINNTFYQLPEAETLEKWRDETPDDFVFSVKASRYITHMKKLKDPQEPVSNFLERISVLKPKLGPVLFQLPPRWKVNPERLNSFLEVLPPDYRYVFEFRDESWFDRRVYDILAAHDAAFCIYHLAGKLSPKKITTDLVYVRLHGPGDAYQGSYEVQTLAGWAGAFSTWVDQGRSIWCYFDNDQAGYAAQNALRLKEITANW